MDLISANIVESATAGVDDIGILGNHWRGDSRLKPLDTSRLREITPKHRYGFREFHRRSLSILDDVYRTTRTQDPITGTILLAHARSCQDYENLYQIWHDPQGTRTALRRYI